MFIAPYEQNTNWNTNGAPGTFRFLQRVWTLTQEFLAAGDTDKDEGSERVRRVAHRTIKRVNDSLEQLTFNTAVAAMMEGVNELYKLKASDGFAARDDWRLALDSLVCVLAPFAPHIAEELWQQLGHDTSVHIGAWPEYDPSLLTTDQMTIVVQVNGKRRGELSVPRDTDEQAVIAAAEAHIHVQPYIASNTIKKTIYVPQKLVNLVL